MLWAVQQFHDEKLFEYSEIDFKYACILGYTSGINRVPFNLLQLISFLLNWLWYLTHVGLIHWQNMVFAHYFLCGADIYIHDIMCSTRRWMLALFPSLKNKAYWLWGIEDPRKAWFHMMRDFKVIRFFVTQRHQLFYASTVQSEVRIKQRLFFLLSCFLVDSYILLISHRQSEFPLLPSSYIIFLIYIAIVLSKHKNGSTYTSIVVIYGYITIPLSINMSDWCVSSIRRWCWKAI